MATLCHRRLNEANKELLESMDVDNVVEGSFMYMCVSVCVCEGRSLPPADNIAVLFCPAAPERISFRLICPLCCWCVAEESASFIAVICPVGH